MKAHRTAMVLAAAVLLSACAYLPPADAPVRRVSPDYVATGDVREARAFLHGKHTVLELAGTPAFLVVVDASGASVAYERVGRHYRLARKVDQFTAWIDGRAVTFSVVKPAPPVASIATPVRAPVHAPGQVVTAPVPTDADLSALRSVADQQLKELRRLLAEAGANPRATGEQLDAVRTRLDTIQARLLAASSAVVRVGFPNGSTRFKPDSHVATALVAAAKAADQVTIRGRTDARIAGPADAKIAWGRAMAARQFLVKHGVDPGKMTVTSHADGDFIAPNLSRAGKAMNRRVEVEVIHHRIASLRDKTAHVVEP